MGIILRLVCGLISLCVILHVLFEKYVMNDAVPGWATMTVSVTFLGGIQLIGIGILGEYIGRIFEEVKQRPLYIVGRHITKHT
jgi:dolichol-phosphate mannosyltransferase